MYVCLTWWALMVFPGLPLGVHCLGRTVGSRWLLLPLEGAGAPRRAYTIRQHQPWESTRALSRKKIWLAQTTQEHISLVT